MSKHKKTKRQNKNYQNEVVQGKISVSSGGSGFVDSPNFEEDIYVSPEDTEGAVSGDEVLVEILKKNKRGRVGRIKEITKRAHSELVGLVEKVKDQYVFKPDNRRVQGNFILKTEESIQSKTKVLAKVTNWKTDPIELELIRIIGKAGVHETEIQAIVYDKGFEIDFPQDVEEEARRIKEAHKEFHPDEINKRRDMRDTLTFTIDPFDAKDFDDALSYKELPNGNFEVGIHIADVSHYVKEGTRLDEEARNRGFSVYLVDRTIPMLPEELSNDLCSLNPNEDKLTFSAIFEITPEAKVEQEWFGKTIIKSDKRFSYEEAQDQIDKGGDHEKALRALNELAKKLKDQKAKAGAIDFDTEEVDFEIDENGKPIRIWTKERLDAHKLIEEFMLLANRHVAGFISEKIGQTNPETGGKIQSFIYRIHEQPDIDKLAQLNVFLEALGYDMKEDRKGKITAKSLQKMLDQIEGKPQESLIRRAAVKSMQKAIYSTKNIGHFGLAFSYYTHFTSPIRRYADLMVHRVLWKYLSGEEITNDAFERYTAIAEDVSQKEIEATRAERESIKYKQVEYMADHIGEEFEGVISGITDWGIFIEEKNTKSEGLARLDAMTEDFTHQEKEFAIKSSNGKKKYSLGDTVKFKVVDANVEEKQLTYQLLG